MTDSQFAALSSIALCAFCIAAGAFATWVWIHGEHECSALVRYEHVTVEYVTHCRL